jgi:hypothetical protein
LFIPLKVNAIKKMKNSVPYIVLLLVAISACNRTTEKQAQLSREIVEDSIFTNRFIPAGGRFTGGDGTYSINLPDGRTVWIFGDSFIGNVTADNRRTKTTPAYIRNSFVVLTPDSLITYQQGDPAEFKSMMIPPEVTPTSGITELDVWYWPGDAFLENGRLNVFVSKFSQKDHSNMWAFKFEATELVEFSLPDFKPAGVHIFNDLDSIHFGHALHETKDYTYIYGLKKKPYVARAKAGDVANGAWEFYDGENWVAEARAAKPMVDFLGSEQFSISEWEGTYIMIIQGDALTRNVYSFTAPTPYGPWGNKQWIYETPLPDSCKSCFTYNAMAHPQFTEDKMLLISYNTNSMEMDDHYKNASIYRPRFIRVPLERILPK